MRYGSFGGMAGVACAALIAASSAASAQGRAPIWTGAYAGVHLGGGWGKLTSDEIDVTVDPSGVVGGGHIGYNFQSGSFVLGVEADLSASNLDWSMTDGPNSVTVSTSYLGSIRARAGVSSGPALFYATAGIAFGNLKAEFVEPGLTGSVTSKETGFVVGGGIEYLVSSNWTARLEGLHYRFGVSEELSGASGRYTVNSLRAGLSYKF